mmetsp:Transcript_19823/g.58890  ORF Transcript_19823/g.58890 Transcript_19823/m.58890 type:complete len:461 (+) Transcript_19823:139-1521(+)
MLLCHREQHVRRAGRAAASGAAVPAPAVPPTEPAVPQHQGVYMSRRRRQRVRQATPAQVAPCQRQLIEPAAARPAPRQSAQQRVEAARPGGAGTRYCHPPQRHVGRHPLRQRRKCGRAAVFQALHRQYHQAARVASQEFRQCCCTARVQLTEAERCDGRAATTAAWALHRLQQRRRLRSAVVEEPDMRHRGGAGAAAAAAAAATVAAAHAIIAMIVIIAEACNLRQRGLEACARHAHARQLQLCPRLDLLSGPSSSPSSSPGTCRAVLAGRLLGSRRRPRPRWLRRLMRRARASARRVRGRGGRRIRRRGGARRRARRAHCAVAGSHTLFVAWAFHQSAASSGCAVLVQTALSSFPPRRLPSSCAHVMCRASGSAPQRAAKAMSTAMARGSRTGAGPSGRPESLRRYFAQNGSRHAVTTREEQAGLRPSSPRLRASAKAATVRGTVVLREAPSAPRSPGL